MRIRSYALLLGTTLNVAGEMQERGICTEFDPESLKDEPEFANECVNNVDDWIKDKGYIGIKTLFYTMGDDPTVYLWSRSEKKTGEMIEIRKSLGISNATPPFIASIDLENNDIDELM